MRALLCPGQGTQSAGMLTPWLDQRTLIDEMSAAAEIDLIAYGCDSDDATVTATSIAQPLIVATGLLSYTALGSPRVEAVAGHSVGELTALAVAGVISIPAAVRLAAVRGRAMADAAARVETTMSAVVGGERDEVLAAIESVGAVAANMNSARQIVAAGTVEQLRTLAGNPPAKARVIPLAVAGAFHTEFMAPAVAAVDAEIATLTASDPHCTLVTNRDGGIVASGVTALSNIVAQITSPVRWDLCQETLSGAQRLVELAPGGVLTGLAKRQLRGIPAMAITHRDDIPSTREFLEETIA